MLRRLNYEERRGALFFCLLSDPARLDDDELVRDAPARDDETRRSIRTKSYRVVFVARRRSTHEVT
jgi:hypothetical protein